MSGQDGWFHGYRRYQTTDAAPVGKSLPFFPPCQCCPFVSHQSHPRGESLKLSFLHRYRVRNEGIAGCPQRKVTISGVVAGIRNGSKVLRLLLRPSARYH